MRVGRGASRWGSEGGATVARVGILRGAQRCQDKWRVEDTDVASGPRRKRNVMFVHNV